MIDKPIHRRRSLVSADQMDRSAARFWLLPVLLLIQAMFVGSTFQTLPTTLGALFFAVLIVGFFLQWFGSVDATGGVRSKFAAANEDDRGATLRGEQPKRPGNRRAKRLRFLRRFAMVLCFLFVTVLGATLRITFHISGSLNVVALFVDATAHIAFLLTVTLWVFYPRRGHPAMLGCGLVLVLATVTGGGVSHTINGQLVAALATIIVFSIASQHILSLWEVTRSRRWHVRRNEGTPRSRELPASTVSISQPRRRSAMIYSILALSVLLMSTSAGGHLAAGIVPGIQLNFFDRLSQSLEKMSGGGIIGGSQYVRGSRLGSVRQHMLGDPAETALRTHAVTAPGYLRGTVFDSYYSGAWSAASARGFSRNTDTSSILPRPVPIESAGQTRLEGESSVVLDRFRLRKNPGGTPVGTVEVHNVPLKGQLVFTSLSTDWIEAATYGVLLTHNDTVIKGIDTREPYVLGICSETPRESLDPIRRQVLTRLPDGLGETIAPYARSACDGRLTARSKARAIEDYFDANFVYSLSGIRTPEDVDPIVNFLKTQHPAHCEFFASAAAVMLRTVGVPTRYVTGYVVTERSEDDRYWLARNRDAHAWVEAYDDITEQWFPVEATVGRTYRTLLSEVNLVDITSGSQDGLLDREEDQSMLSMIIGRLLSVRTTDSLTFLFRIAQLPLFCIVIGLLWIRNRQKVRDGSDPMEYESRQMLQRVDRRVKKYALVRDRNETLHQFASRVESVAQQRQDAETFLAAAANWYRSFASARYRGVMPLPMETTT